MGGERRLHHEAYRVETSQGPIFVKAGDASAASMFAAEAAGLDELARADAIRVPSVLGTGEDGSSAFIALEWIECRPADSMCDARLGEQLAALHATTRSAFGWTRDNTIGLTTQRNASTSDWIEFWRNARLQPQLELAKHRGASFTLLNKGELVVARLDHMLAHAPVASLLHGDLWSGNRARDEHGQPVIFDPAVYFGDRETDLAMMKLFGGFDRECYQAYERAWPLPAGHEQRVELYQLYHVLNHFNLFGGPYAAQAERLMDRIRAN